MPEEKELMVMHCELSNYFHYSKRWTASLAIEIYSSDIALLHEFIDMAVEFMQKHDAPEEMIHRLKSVRGSKG